MELKDWCQVFWKRRLWLLTPFVLATAGAIAYDLKTPPTYESSTKILLEHKDRTLSTLGKDMGELGELTTVSRSGNPVDTQVEMAKSETIVKQVIEQLKMTDPATGAPITPDQFRAKAKAGGIKGTDLLQLTYRDADAVRAQQIADTWGKVFIETNQAANRQDANETVKFISGQLKKTREELEQAESALRDFRQANRAIDLSEEAKASVLTAANIEAEVRQTQAAVQDAQSRADTLRRQIGLSSSQALASAALSQDATIQRLRAQLLEAETSLSNITLAPSHPEVVQRKAQVAILEKKLADHSRTLLGRRYSGGTAVMDPVRQGLTKDLIAAESEALGYRTRLEALRRNAGNFNGQLAALPAKEYQLTRLERNAAATAEVYKMLLQKFEEAKIQAAMSVSNARILDAANRPETPIWPKPFLVLLAGMAGGALLGAAAVCLREYFDDTIQKTEVAEKVLPLPTLGIIPWIATKEFEPLVTLSQPRSPAAESYRTLRTNIKFLSSVPLRTITFTSAGSGEGKSTTVANLALAFAQTGKQVLVVDADMRMPTLHAIFALPNKVGLANVLTGDLPFEQVVQRTQHPNLQVVTCGPLPPDPAELLESARFAEFLELVRERYDMVLFDAPPIIAVTDASILASRLDGLILQVGINRVTQRAAKHALALLKAAKIKVHGMVIGGMRPDNDPYYNSYYHRYYGRAEANHKKQKPLKKGAPAA